MCRRPLDSSTELSKFLKICSTLRWVKDLLATLQWHCYLGMQPIQYQRKRQQKNQVWSYTLNDALNSFGSLSKRHYLASKIQCFDYAADVEEKSTKEWLWSYCHRKKQALHRELILPPDFKYSWECTANHIYMCKNIDLRSNRHQLKTEGVIPPILYIIFRFCSVQFVLKYFVNYS